MEDGGTGGRRAQEDVKKEEALVRGSEEEPTKKTPPPSHFKPAGTIEFRIGADSRFHFHLAFMEGGSGILPLDVIHPEPRRLCHGSAG